MAKQNEQRSTDIIILKEIGVVKKDIKRINAKLIPICTIIKGNGSEPLPKQVKDNTDWRLEMSGGLKVLKLLLVFLTGSSVLTLIVTFLRMFKIIHI